jgi:hypothetical protein
METETKFPPFTDPKTKDGKNAYDVLRERNDCPIRLPRARSMTQAKIDYEQRANDIIKWYNNQKENGNRNS